MPVSPPVFNDQVSIVNNIQLLSSSARTATGTGDVCRLEGFELLVLQLDVTAAATEAGDTLDVYLQTSIDGTNWIDAMHFTQVVGNGGAKRYISKLSATLSLTEFEAGASLSAAAVRHIFGSDWRVRWAITDASTANASFTFSVKANAT